MKRSADMAFILCFLPEHADFVLEVTGPLLSHPHPMARFKAIAIKKSGMLDFRADTYFSIRVIKEQVWVTQRGFSHLHPRGDGAKPH